MGKPTGFLEYTRLENGDRPPEERLSDFLELHTTLREETRREQAARCMSCGVPLCQSGMVLSGMTTGCPLHNLIPEWNDHIYRGNDAHAFSRLIKTGNFPEFTGRVCPALCEKACVCGEYDDPVTIRDNEKYLAETAFEKGYIRPVPPAVRSGRRVAVVGSGPAGLAAADTLNHRGHQVTVFEREDRIGGLLMYGIPNMKLEKEVILRRQRLMEQEGVEFRTGVDVGKTLSPEELLRDYDAVILACGAKEPRRLFPAETAEGKLTEGVYYAVDFLTATTRSLLEAEDRTVAALEKQGGYINARNKSVVVVGGGDTGNDCIATVLRQGCRSVTALEMMPEPPVERLPQNPWPEWPKVRKTDYGHEEAIARFGQDPRLYQTTVKELITGKKGRLEKLKIVSVRMENGKLQEVPGTEKLIPCNLLLIAAGFTGCQPYTAEAFHTPLTARGTVETAPEGYRTGVEKVFATGDMRRGQSLVVWAIAEGRRCAREVDSYLMGYTTLREE